MRAAVRCWEDQPIKLRSRLFVMVDDFHLCAKFVLLAFNALLFVCPGFCFLLQWRIWGLYVTNVAADVYLCASTPARVRLSTVTDLSISPGVFSGLCKMSTLPFSISLIAIQE